MLRRLKNRIKFELEHLILRGASYRLLLIVLVIIGISLLAGLLVHRATGEFSGLGEASWWAFLRLTDPGYLGDDQGVLLRTVSTVVTMLGYVVFLGALVAIMIQALNTGLGRLQMGLTPIAESGHFLILGWTNRTPTIVKELLLSEPQVRSFLRQHGTRGFNIVILVEELTPQLVQELRDALGPLYNGRKITLRTGSPLRIDHLRRVDFLNAGAILLPLPEAGLGSGTSADGRTLKILLSIGSARGEGVSTGLPLLVTEISDADKTLMAERAYGGPIEVLPSDRLISRLIAQTVRQPGLSYLFAELFTQEYGNELYIQPVGNLAGRRYGELFASFPCAVVLGILRGEPGAPTPMLNPPRDTPLEASDRLVLVARSQAEAVPVVRDAAMPAAVPAQSLARLPRRRRVLVLGWNMRMPSLLRELDADPGEAEVCILSTLASGERQRLLAGLALKRVRVHHADGDYANPGVVAELKPQAYDNVVMLASDRLDSDVDADTRTVLGYLMLQECLGGEGARPAVLVELLDPDNVGLFRTRPDEVLLSPLILSHMLAQVTLRRELSEAFDELFGPRGPALRFQSVVSLGLADRSLRFGDIQQAVHAQGRTALGLRLQGERGQAHGGLHLNPPRSRSWLLRPGDEVVILG